MAHLEDITVGCSVSGIAGNNAVEIVAVKWFGTAALEVTYKNSSGQAGNQLLFRDQEESLEIVGDALPWSFTADSDLMRLCSEAYRIQLAHLFDPYLAIHTSAIEPSPTRFQPYMKRCFQGSHSDMYWLMILVLVRPS